MNQRPIPVFYVLPLVTVFCVLCIMAMIYVRMQYICYNHTIPTILKKANEQDAPSSNDATAKYNSADALINKENINSASLLEMYDAICSLEA